MSGPPRYEIWWQGELPAEAVHLEVQPLTPYALTDQERCAVSEVCQQFRQRGQRVENLPIYHFLDWRLEADGLHLSVSRSWYEDYLGLGELNHPAAPIALAVSAATEVEGRLVIERRSGQVSHGRGLLHVKPSGHVQPPDSPWQAVQREAWEELALRPHELQRPLCLGLVRSLTANCVTLVYRLNVGLSWSEWSARAPQDAWESSEILALPSDRASLCDWLHEAGPRTTGPGHAAVLRYFQHRYSP